MGILDRTQNWFVALLAQSRFEGIPVFLSAMLKAGVAVSNTNQFKQFMDYYESNFISDNALACYELFAVAYNRLGLRFENGSFQIKPDAETVLVVIHDMEAIINKMDASELKTNTNEYRSLTTIVLGIREILANLKVGDYERAQDTFNYRFLHNKYLYPQILGVTIEKASQLNIVLPTTNQES